MAARSILNVPCKFYLLGACRNGDNCPFDHRKIPDQENYFPSCKYFFTKDGCTNNTCAYQHPKPTQCINCQVELYLYNGSYLEFNKDEGKSWIHNCPNIICKFYINGGCSKGPDCRYKHVILKECSCGERGFWEKDKFYSVNAEGKVHDHKCSKKCRKFLDEGICRCDNKCNLDRSIPKVCKKILHDQTCPTLECQYTHPRGNMGPCRNKGCDKVLFIWGATINKGLIWREIVDKETGEFRYHYCQGRKA